MFFYCCWFVLCFVGLSIVFGVSENNKPQIILDENWRYLSRYDLFKNVCWHYEKNPTDGNHIIYNLDNIDDIASVLHRHFYAQKKYEESSRNGGEGIIVALICYIWLISSFSFSLRRFDYFGELPCSIVIAVVLSIVAYKLILRFAPKSIKAIQYIEYEWSADLQPFLPEEFENCYEYLKAEKDRCVERLSSRALAYEHATHYMEYHHSAFRWSGVFFVLALHSTPWIVNL